MHRLPMVTECINVMTSTFLQIREVPKSDTTEFFRSFPHTLQLKGR